MFWRESGLFISSPVTWTLGRLNWLMVAGSTAAARITGTNGSQDIGHPETVWITGGGREEMSTGGAEATLHSPEVFGTIQSHGGASALTCHSWGWALTRWTGIILAASYIAQKRMDGYRESCPCSDTREKKQIDR